MVFVFLHILNDNQKDQSIYNTFINSIYTFYPEAEVIQVSDKHTPAINKVSNVFRYDGNTKKIMEFRVNANKELGLTKPAIYLDSDMIITNRFNLKKMLNLDKTILLRRSFDLNIKFNTKIKNQEFDEYSNYTIDKVFPILACLLKTNSYVFWEEMSKYLYTLEDKFLYWYGDQEILKKLYLENKERFYLIEEKYFACPPQFLDKKKFPYLIHFKGLQNKENLKSQINLINSYLDVVKKSL
tara:strand:- start:88 stop:810 length:723 start_codon:yes stop_codon:yes gene_type:complete